ncbi:MAG: DUF1501 domain-containing protein [Phycisphaerae bacterium]|nr:DUF1501 domain-containing protein [Phycisphaerae bacterium]
MTTPTPYSRRIFLQHGVTLASMAATIPQFIQQSALGMLLGGSGVPEERVLVIIQLGGGNDGLNTVVPFGSREYYAARPSIAIGGPGTPRDQTGQALVLDQAKGIGLHPNLTGIKELFDGGRAAVIQGVGYPNPNRSHFTSMDIWHTARTDGKGTGWVGRYFDCTCNGTPSTEGAVAIGQAPLAMMGETQKPIAFESAEMFRWLGDDLHKALHDPYQAINRAGSLDGIEPNTQMNFLMRTSLDAQVSSDRIRNAVNKQPLVAYPQSSLANQLRTIGAMIRDGMKTRVYYASISGFDTHGGQLGTHGNLMRQFGDAVLAFQNDLKAQGNDERVATLCFSEFGRRVAQNGSAGTDHGTAGPVFLLGAKVRAGLLGEHPSMTDLDQGDLRHTVDFRSVYAGILEDWLVAPSAKVLDGAFQKAALFRA